MKIEASTRLLAGKQLDSLLQQYYIDGYSDKNDVDMNDVKLTVRYVTELLKKSKTLDAVSTAADKDPKGLAAAMVIIGDVVDGESESKLKPLVKKYGADFIESLVRAFASVAHGD